MAQMILTYKDLYERVQKFLGTYGSSGASAGSAALTDSQDFVHDGYLNFLNAYDWTFKRRYTSLSTKSGEFCYMLPEGFTGMRTPFTYRSNTGYSPPTELAPDEIMELRNYGTTNSWPQYYAIRSGDYSPETGQRQEAIFWPEPDSTYDFYYSHYWLPEKLSNDTDVPIGGPETSQAIKELCLAAAEAEKDDGSTQVHMQLAGTQLQLLIQADKKREPRSVGMMNGPDRLSNWEVSRATSWVVARGTTRVNDVTYTL